MKKSAGGKSAKKSQVAEAPQPGTAQAADRERRADDGVEREAPLQGEGNYAAARRHRQSAETFVESGRVEEAAREASPDDAQEAQALRDAEDEGRSHARR